MDPKTKRNRISADRSSGRGTTKTKTSEGENSSRRTTAKASGKRATKCENECQEEGDVVKTCQMATEEVKAIIVRHYEKIFYNPLTIAQEEKQVPLYTCVEVDPIPECRLNDHNERMRVYCAIQGAIKCTTQQTLDSLYQANREGSVLCEKLVPLQVPNPMKRQPPHLFIKPLLLQYSMIIAVSNSCSWLAGQYHNRVAPVVNDPGHFRTYIPGEHENLIKLWCNFACIYSQRLASMSFVQEMLQKCDDCGAYSKELEELFVVNSKALLLAAIEKAKATNHESTFMRGILHETMCRVTKLQEDIANVYQTLLRAEESPCPLQYGMMLAGDFLNGWTLQCWRGSQIYVASMMAYFATLVGFRDCKDAPGKECTCEATVIPAVQALLTFLDCGGDGKTFLDGSAEEYCDDVEGNIRSRCNHIYDKSRSARQLAYIKETFTAPWLSSYQSSKCPPPNFRCALLQRLGFQYSAKLTPPYNMDAAERVSWPVLPEIPEWTPVRDVMETRLEYKHLYPRSPALASKTIQGAIDVWAHCFDNITEIQFGRVEHEPYMLLDEWLCSVKSKMLEKCDCLGQCEEQNDCSRNSSVSRPEQDSAECCNGNCDYAKEVRAIRLRQNLKHDCT